LVLDYHTLSQDKSAQPAWEMSLSAYCKSHRRSTLWLCPRNTLPPLANQWAQGQAPAKLWQIGHLYQSSFLHHYAQSRKG
jgi:hypothetical protein